MNKTIKTTIITTCTQEYYDRFYAKMKSMVDSGEVKKKFMTDEDIKDGVINVDITFEDETDN